MAESRSRRSADPPTVWLVGAGPGDPELLTVKAIKAIRRATVLLVDDLVGDDIVAFARKGLKRPVRTIWVGKRGGCKSTPQAFIEQLMIREALAGQRVVRLKGGDPALFGRSGEEAQALRQAGVQVEVVHGITAALSAADALGAPLTHREHAQGVMFVTGHVKAGGQPQDWEAIGRAARSGITLVVYMGLAQVARLQTALLGQLSPATPAAIVQNASTPAERHVVCTLANLADTARREGFASPSVLIVGDVLRAGLIAAPQLASRPQRRSAV